MKPSDTRTTLTILSSLTVIACSQDQIPEYAIVQNQEPVYRDYSQFVTVKQTESYGVYEPHDSPEAWITISDVVKGPEGGVFIVDPFGKGVHYLVPGEGVRFSYGLGIGQGPGEFLQPLNAAWDGGNNLYISDEHAVRLLVFTIGGEFVRHITSPPFPSSMTFSNEGSLWVTLRGSYPFDRLIRINVLTGDILDDIGGHYEGTQWLAGGGRFNTFVNSYLHGVIQGHSYPYELLLYSDGGVLEKVIEGHTPWLTPQEFDELNRWSQRNGYVRRPVCFPDGKILVHLLQFTGPIENIKRSGYFDIFDPEGIWLTSIPLEEFNEDGYENDYVVRYTVASDGAAWIAYIGDYPTVCRYELDFTVPL